MKSSNVVQLVSPSPHGNSVPQQTEPVLIEKGILLEIKFGFRQKHGTVKQVHRIADIICETMETK